MPAAEWQRWLDQLLDGLAHVHGHGYLHRDIKPGNIIIRAADSEPVLIDFGAARVAARERTHTQVFTRLYAPIEQHASQGAQGPPTDIYALAAVSCEALTGEPPPSAPDRMLDDRYEPLAKRVADADAAWLTAIDQGMALRPETRPQTVAAWRATLLVAHGASAEAVGWYREAARLGDAHAQFTLGLMYANGKGVPEDGKEALAWYRRAAEQGHAAAQFTLGHMYFLGVGAPRNTAEIAAAWRGWLASDQLPLWFTDSGYAEEGSVPRNVVRAAEWFRKAADRGHMEAQFVLGVMLVIGRDVPKDLVQAAGWFRKAADQGDAEAQFVLGVMHANGACAPKDAVQAAAWFHKAADQGHASAQCDLGVMYENGKGVPADPGRAVGWFRQAADQWHARAQYNLGWMYANGKGVPADGVQAAAWYREAADQGHAKAIFGVGVVCLNDVNVPDDDGGEYLRSSKCANISETGHEKAESQFKGASYRTLMLQQSYPILQEYQEFVDSHYLDLDDHELKNDEEEHLTWFYTMYEDLRNDSGGFELVFDSLCNEDSIERCDVCAKKQEINIRCDECAKKWEFHREMIQESVVSHVTTGLEYCGDDRAEVLSCCDGIDETLSACLDRIDNVDLDTDEIGGSVEEISRLLSTSSWFEDWKQDKYAIDVFVKCIGKLRDCQKNVFRALRSSHEREFTNIGIDEDRTSVDLPDLLRNSM